MTEVEWKHRVPSPHDALLDCPEAKLAYNRLHFSEAARHYDLGTRMLSLGRDASWKRQLVDALPDEPATVLDLACGTGDICFLLAERFPKASIEGLDLTRDMIEIAEARNHFGARVGFVQGDICNLAYDDASQELITGSYALRNAPDLSRALQEIHRVLRPGGVAAFLDFSKSVSRSVQTIQYWALRIWGGLWGLLLHRNPSVHGYIAASLRCYPDRRQLNLLFRQLGFEHISSKSFVFGCVELVLLRKKDAVDVPSHA
jgi:demethylmenaquinone methyltransferase/2-methoxy-6-polyprenyl-1,4-benzoquinol methylase